MDSSMREQRCKKNVETSKKQSDIRAAFLLSAFVFGSGLFWGTEATSFAVDSVDGDSMESISTECGENIVWLRGEWGTVRFRVEIADEPEEQQQGLMHRENMPASAGMLFVYPNARPASFWMANTLIPLDMLFFDASGRMINLHENAVPLDRSPIFGGDEVKAVLEINGGLSRNLGLFPTHDGAALPTEIAHPSFENDLAVFPCATR